MKIEEILKELQPCEYVSLDKKRKEVKVSAGVKHRREITPGKIKTPREENLNIEELMSTRYYRRGRGGAIKQVR